MTAKKKDFVPAKMGRPPMPEGAKRLDRVTIVLHESELETIRKKATEEGFSSLSDWGRKTLLAAAKD
jgi:hypothetical protein